MGSQTTYLSDLLVQEVRQAVEHRTLGWEDKVEALCRYHLEMRDHALALERTIHRITKGG